MKPRVTEILKPFSDFSMIAPEVLELASLRGSEVHKSCEAYALGIWAPVPEGLQGYFDSFRAWFDKYVVEVLAVEEEIEHKSWGYIGHPDLIARIKGVRPMPAVAVVDFKTPIAATLSWHCQLAAYVEAARQKYKSEIGGSLQLRKDGSLPKMIWVDDQVQAFAAFTGILSGWNYIKGGK